MCDYNLDSCLLTPCLQIKRRVFIDAFTRKPWGNINMTLKGDGYPVYLA